MKRSQANRRRLCIQTLESRRVLAASFGWDGPGLGSATLTYNIANSPASLTQSETNAAIETALAAWSLAADITFVPTTQRGLRDSIDISFTSIDGRGGTLAQAYFPDDVNPARIAGDIQFDLSEVWEVGNSLGNQAFDLVWVAAHEIGHSLGLDHANEIASVLAPFVSPRTQFVSLAASDAAAIGQLYAAEDTPIDETPADSSSSDDPASDDPASDDPADPGDGDDDPLPRRRWRWSWRWGGFWGRFGGRLAADVPQNHNLYNPTDVNGDDSTTALDALMIINQLSLPSSGDDASVTGMCDTNADGSITALDALTVINAMDSAESDAGSSDVILTIDDAETSSDDPIVVDEDPSSEEEHDEEMMGDDEMPFDELDDDETTSDDDADDEQGALDDQEEPDDDDQEMVDDGGLLDENGEDDDDDEHDCHDGRFGQRIARFLRAGKLESLFSRFDTFGDGVLTEGEVPSFLWERLIDRGVDADGNDAITVEEIEAAVAAARADWLAEHDEDGDGLLQEDEVSERFWEKISEADANADGGISPDELATWLADRQTEYGAAPGFGHMHDRIDQVFRQLGRGGIRALGRFR